MSLRNSRSNFFVFQLFMVIFFFGPLVTLASPSDSVPGSFSIATSPSCPSNPGCSECGSCSCSQYVSYCTDKFTNMDGVVDIFVEKLPFERSQSDVPSLCTNPAKTCDGGRSLCKVTRIPTEADNVLVKWTTNNPEHNFKKAPATEVTCKYYDPQCYSCCAAWTCNCVACPDE